MTDLIHSEDRPAYDRLHSESFEEYELFIEWAKTPPSSRSIANLQRKTGASVRRIRDLRNKHIWDDRTTAYDHDCFKLSADAGVVADEVSPEWQISLGKKLIEIGITGLEAKDPTLINVDKLRKLVMDGAELVRKGQGLADLTISVDTSDMSRVNDLLMEVIDVEEIEDGD